MCLKFNIGINISYNLVVKINITSVRITENNFFGLLAIDAHATTSLVVLVWKRIHRLIVDTAVRVIVALTRSTVVRVDLISRPERFIVVQRQTLFTLQ